MDFQESSKNNGCFLQVGWKYFGRGGSGESDVLGREGVMIMKCGVINENPFEAMKHIQKHNQL